MKSGENLNSVRALMYLENSYIKELLEDDDVTDISFNGEYLYYVSNTFGRKRSEIQFTNEMAKDFLRQIANLSEKQFSYQLPLLNVSIGNFRINGVFNSIGRLKNNKVFTFSIRKAFKESKISKNSKFLPKELILLFKTFLDNGISMILAGQTGSGKTELQKYLLSELKENTRVIVIDEVLELALINEPNYLDLNIWQVDNGISIQELIRNALRSNPDWLIVSEARGEEMFDILTSSLTGHPIITTIHSLDVESIPSRVINMVLSKDKDINTKAVLDDFTHHIKIGVFLKKIENRDNKIIRYISDICEFNEDGTISYIYKKTLNKEHFFKISNNLINKLDQKTLSNEFKNIFIKEENK